MWVRGRWERSRVRAGQTVRMDPLGKGPVKVLDTDHWASNLEDLLGTRPDPAELGAGLVMEASEAEASSLARGEEALVGAFVVLGFGTTLGEPEIISDLGKALGLLTEVLIGQRLRAGSRRAGRGATDYLRRGAGVLEISQEVGSVASGRMYARVISVNGLGKVEVPILKVAFVKEALKVGQDGAVGALTSTIALGW